MASNKIRGITIELNADTAGIMDGLKDLNSSLANTSKSLKDVDKLLKMDPGNITLLSQKQEYLTSAIEDTKKKLEEEKALLENMKSADNASETIEQQKALEREIEATTQQLGKYEGELGKTSDALNDMGDKADKSSEKIESTEGALMALAQSGAFSMISENTQKIYEALLRCNEVADKFETSMAKINTLAGLDTGNLAAMGQELRGYSQDLGVSASDLAEAAYQAMSAGVDTGSAAKFAADSTKLAIGGFTDASTAVDIVTTALNAYGLEASETEHIMDNLITTQNLGKTTVNELASSMGKVIPTASAYNVNLNNLSAAYAELTAKGIKTKIATTDLNAMLNELGKDSSNVNGILQEMSGKTFAELMDEGESLGDVMKTLWEYVDGDKAAFMGLWQQSTAATAAFNLAADGGDKFNEILKQMETNAGATEEAFQTMAETSEQVDARFNAAVENLEIAIGKSLSPILDTLKQNGIKALEPFTKFVEDNPELVGAIAGVVTGMVTATGVVAGLAAMVTLLKTALSGVTGILPMLIGAGVAGGLFGLMTAFSSTSETAGQLADKLREINKAADEAISSINKGTQVEILLNKIQKLNSVAELSASEFNEMQTAVEDYNAIMEGTSQIILDASGHIEDMIGVQSELAKAQSYYDDLRKEYTENEKKYNEQLALQKELKEKAKELEEDYAQALIIGSTSAKLYKEQLDSVNRSLEDSQGSMKDAKSRMIELEEEMGPAQKAIQDLTEAEKDEKEAMDDSTAATNEFIKKLDGMKSAIANSIQGSLDLTSKWKEDWKTSTSEMTTNIQSQIDGIRNWATNFETLANAAEVNIDSRVLEYLGNLGVKGSGLVQELVNTLNQSPEQLQDWADKMEEYLSLDEEISKTIIQSYVDSITGICEESATTVEEGMPAVQEQFNLAYEQQQLDAETHRQNMTQLSAQMMTDITSAITENTVNVTTAARQMMEMTIKEVKTAIGYSDETGRAQKFFELGEKIDQSIADGITENGSVVAQALQNMLNNAIDSLDISGIAAKINAALGSALGG